MRKRFVALVILVGVILPVTASAQIPAFLAEWPAPRAVGIAFDPAGNIYVAELSNFPTHIDVHAPDGTLLASWGTDGPDVFSVTGPYYIAADSNGHLFIAEWTIHNLSQFPLQEFTTSGSFVAGVGFYSPSPSSVPGAITGVGGVAVGPDGRIFVTDAGNPRTQVFANDRTFLIQWPSQGNSIAIDAFGHAFEVEQGGIIRKYDANSGAELKHWGSAGPGPGQFNTPKESRSTRPATCT